MGRVTYRANNNSATSGQTAAQVQTAIDARITASEVANLRDAFLEPNEVIAGPVGAQDVFRTLDNGLWTVKAANLAAGVTATADLNDDAAMDAAGFERFTAGGDSKVQSITVTPTSAREDVTTAAALQASAEVLQIKNTSAAFVAEITVDGQTLAIYGHDLINTFQKVNGVWTRGEDKHFYLTPPNPTALQANAIIALYGATENQAVQTVQIGSGANGFVYSLNTELGAYEQQQGTSGGAGEANVQSNYFEENNALDSYIVEAPLRDYEVWVITGQSNAVGVFGGSENPASDKVAVYDPVTGALGSSDYTAAPFSRGAPDGNAGNNNIGLSFVHERNIRTGKRQILIYHAIGGRPIEDWLFTANGGIDDGATVGHYTPLKAKVEAALGLASITNTQVDGVIWIQGEQNNNNGDSEAAYTTKLVSLHNQFVAETWFSAFTPFIVVEPSNTGGATSTAQKANNVHPSFIAVPNTDAALGDTIHYDADSLVMLGKRVTQAIDGRVQPKAQITLRTLDADIIFYVRQDGNDGNDGLANFATRAFLTINKALEEAAKLILAGNRVLVRIGDGTWAENLVIPILVGQKTISDFVIESISGNAAACILAGDGVGTAIEIPVDSKCNIRNLTVDKTANGTGIDVAGGSTQLSNVRLGDASVASLLVRRNGRCELTGTLTMIAGTTLSGIRIDTNGVFESVARTLDLDGNRTGNLIEVRAGFCLFQNTTFSNTSGTNTGRSYLVSGGILETFGDLADIDALATIAGTATGATGGFAS